jgi:AAA family ATP:ADP antiporter
LWVGIFNIVTIAQFWSFSADIYTEEQGKRLFPIIGIGSSVGAVGGAWLASPIVAHGTPFTLMMWAAAIFLIALGVTWLVQRREAPKEKSAKKEEPVASGNAFAMVLKDRYLLLFAGLVLALNFVTKTGDYVLDRMLLDAAPAHAAAAHLSQTAYIAQFKAHYFQLINTIGVVLQLFIVSRVIKYAGIKKALILIPIASVAGYGTAFVIPLLTVLFVGRVVESSLDYSLSSTTQQTLWLPTSREAKYKAKQVVDAFCRRGGDAISAGVVWVGMHWAFGTRGFLAINVAVTIAWIAFAWAIGRRFAQLAPDAERNAPVGVTRRKVRREADLPGRGIQDAEEVPGE